MKKYHLGIDIGSISINMVMLDQSLNIIENYYLFCQGKPFERLLQQLETVLQKYSPRCFEIVCSTGGA